MHPAGSVIAFTTLSGVGFGLLAWLGLALAPPSAGARHFGDFADPESAVSRLTAERGGRDLMPEQGTKPVNKYLPPRPRDSWSTAEQDRAPTSVLAPLLAPVAEEARGFIGWLDRALEKL